MGGTFISGPLAKLASGARWAPLLGGALLAAGCDTGPAVTVARPRIEMPDGVKLAADVILPDPMPAERVPTVLVQTRYWRSFQLVVPDPPGAVPPMPREDLPAELIARGFAVVVVDVRGTGASEGTWPHPWSAAEVADMGTILDWIAAQPWSNGRIGATGVSYEGTTALLAASVGRPALKAVAAREIEWDVVPELVAPGGVRNLSFPAAWAETVNLLDRNEYPPLFPTSAAWVVDGVHRTDDDPDGTALAERVATRSLADVLGDLEDLRLSTDTWGSRGPIASSIGPSAAVTALATSTAALGIWGSWWDGATADAVLHADAALRAAGGRGLAEAEIGPWNHEGTASANPLGVSEADQVLIADIAAFFDRHLMQNGSPHPSPRRWFVAGPNRWEDAKDWPSTRSRPLYLAQTGASAPEGASAPLVLQEAPAALRTNLDVDFTASLGKESRWMAGMLHPVVYRDLATRPGVLRFDTAPLAEGLRWFGAARFQCEVIPQPGEAALHVGLELVEGGTARYLTEGVMRVKQPQHVDIALRSLAVELPPQAVLRLTVAGADADTFERVPAEGPARITLMGSPSVPCTLALPERVPTTASPG